MIKRKGIKRNDGLLKSTLMFRLLYEKSVMVAYVADPREAQDLIRKRREEGLDRWDEVWEGVYILMPLANNEHQSLVTNLAGVLLGVIERPGRGRVFAGCNVSDRKQDWAQNFRCPDVAVYLASNPAEDCGTHWVGGPDLAIEVVSEGDRAHEKGEFYASVGTRELLLLDRDPWQLSLFRNTDGAMKFEGLVQADQPISLMTETLGIEWGLASGTGRPTLELSVIADGQRFTV
ncbi:hypothetical protein Pan189_06600 [Stratiformator vulcanicus]|uniref:Putative restriction endonuclease domain-containing protein n=1 Tax=Stratiformator vulcanicus TaxID=2527980 RepID=A0A517QXG5_9PLAN|nr:hypothetical protein Pan189_06600 [Stratiformator vulcanicus]